jgi:hypothetical protein
MTVKSGPVISLISDEHLLCWTRSPAAHTRKGAADLSLSPTVVVSASQKYITHSKCGGSRNIVSTTLLTCPKLNTIQSLKRGSD